MKNKLKLLALLAIMLILAGCPAEPELEIPPKVKTSEQVQDITYNSAVVAGAVLNPGTSPVLRKGICWSSYPDNFTDYFPSINDNVILVSEDNFSVVLENLQSNTNYAFSAFAENSVGTTYGKSIKFRTEFETITDIDGNKYRVVKIGNQVWTADNLNVTRLRNGAPINHRIEDVYWAATGAPKEPAMCWYHNDREQYQKPYGALYNWYAASHPLLAPEGWRVPIDEDYIELANFLENNAGGKMKIPGFDYWLAPNTGANNSSHFSAYPGGGRGNEGGFCCMKEVAYFWCSNEFGGHGSVNTLTHRSSYSDAMVLSSKNTGFSIRLIKK